MATIEATVGGVYADCDGLEQYGYAVQGVRTDGMLPSEACQLLAEVAFEAVAQAEDEGMTPSDVTAWGEFRTPGGREYSLVVAFRHDGGGWWGAEGSMNIEPLGVSELPDALAHIARDDYESARALAEALREELPADVAAKCVRAVETVRRA